MFDAISSTYDPINRIMTFGLDQRWRRKVGKLLPQRNLRLLDCATGTGDQIFALVERCPQITEAVGIDLSSEMLSIAMSKCQTFPLQKKVQFQRASALEIPFPEASFDCVTMSFGIRNVTQTDLCLKEIFRVLKPGGRLLILETSLPKNSFIRKLHLLYLRKGLPFIGGWISRQKKAYRYLNETTETFPSGDAFCLLLKQAGMHSVHAFPLALGAVSIYQADKPC